MKLQIMQDLHIDYPASGRPSPLAEGIDIALVTAEARQ